VIIRSVQVFAWIGSALASSGSQALLHVLNAVIEPAGLVATVALRSQLLQSLEPLFERLSVPRIGRQRRIGEMQCRNQLARRNALHRQLGAAADPPYQSGVGGFVCQRVGRPLPDG
jgi:hypothetical protein